LVSGFARSSRFPRNSVGVWMIIVMINFSLILSGTIIVSRISCDDGERWLRVAFRAVVGVMWIAPVLISVALILAMIQLRLPHHCPRCPCDEGSVILDWSVVTRSLRCCFDGLLAAACCRKATSDERGRRVVLLSDFYQVLAEDLDDEDDERRRLYRLHQQQQQQEQGSGPDLAASVWNSQVAREEGIYGAGPDIDDDDRAPRGDGHHEQHYEQDEQDDEMLKASLAMRRSPALSFDEVAHRPYETH